jgi:hypothetical protein
VLLALMSDPTPARLSSPMYLLGPIVCPPPPLRVGHLIQSFIALTLSIVVYYLLVDRLFSLCSLSVTLQFLPLLLVQSVCYQWFL